LLAMGGLLSMQLSIPVKQVWSIGPKGPTPPAVRIRSDQKARYRHSMSARRRSRLPTAPQRPVMSLRRQLFLECFT
jgi:hypothetical protein